MRRELLDHLVCPACCGNLTLKDAVTVETEIETGILACSCGEEYAIASGVPSLVVGSRPSYTFDKQWHEHPYGDLSWELNLEERVEIFSEYFGIHPLDFGKYRLLDAGCGTGMFSAALARAGLDVTAIDYSDSVFRARKLADSPRLSYVQGDLQKPPFRAESYDLVYADGVLHHTPDTKRSFLAVSKTVAQGGRFFVWLYRSDRKGLNGVKRAVIDVIRSLTYGWSDAARMRLCWAGAALMNAALAVARSIGFRGRRLVPIRNKAVGLFDTISPRFNHEHTFAEVREWFREAGFSDIHEVTTSRFNLHLNGFAAIGTRMPSAMA